MLSVNFWTFWWKPCDVHYYLRLQNDDALKFVCFFRTTQYFCGLQTLHGSKQSAAITYCLIGIKRAICLESWVMWNKTGAMSGRFVELSGKWCILKFGSRLYTGLVKIVISEWETWDFKVRAGIGTVWQYTRWKGTVPYWHFQSCVKSNF